MQDPEGENPIDDFNPPAEDQPEGGSFADGSGIDLMDIVDNITPEQPKEEEKVEEPLANGAGPDEA
jgi:hypothetical protein